MGNAGRALFRKGNVFPDIVLDVVTQLRGIYHFDVCGQSDDESAYTFEAGDGGVEEPGFAVFFEVLLGQGEFLYEEGFGAGVELEFDGDGTFAGHPEHIDLEAAMV